jgi:hypothetical protein
LFPPSMPLLVILTVTFPAEVTVIPKDQLLPLPVNVPFTAEPVPLVTVISLAVKPETVALKTKLMAVVLAVLSAVVV